MSLNCGHKRAIVEWYWQGNTEAFGEKPVPVRLYHHNSRGLTRVRTLASAVTDGWLTAWAMAQPFGSNHKQVMPFSSFPTRSSNRNYITSTSCSDADLVTNLSEANQTADALCKTLSTQSTLMLQVVYHCNPLSLSVKYVFHKPHCA
jgi:hypothetical protein